MFSKSKLVVKHAVVGARAALSSKTTPVSASAAAGLRLNPTDSADMDQSGGGGGGGSSNTVRGNPGLVTPKYLSHSYSVSRPYDIHLLCDTIGDRVNVLAKEKPNDVAFKFALTQMTLTFGEIKQRIDELAQNFLRLGFKKGDRIALLLPNMPETVLSLLAASSIGLLVVLMNPAYQLTEIEFMLKKTGARGIVILDNLKSLQHYSILCRICPELATSSKGELNSANLPHLKHVILVKNRLIPNPSTDVYKGTWSYIDDMQRFDRPFQPTPHVDFDDPFVMLFTSGTTGTPKGAVLSHFNLINGAYMDIYASNLVNESRVIACPIPMFHVFGLAAGVLEPYIIGAKTVFPSFLPDTLALIKAIHNDKCTAIKGAPIIFNDLINHPERKNYDMSSLKYALLGASAIPPTLLKAIRQELGVQYILPGYGLTESSAAATLCRVNHAEKYKENSIGEPMPFVELKIVDGDNQIVPVNTHGEICVRGYNVMKGYWDEPKKTAETIDKHGWLRTGDIGCMNEEGIVFFKSRAKELIIRGGVNIYPAEIEAFMRTHDQVVDAACFGYPDPRSDEEVCVWIKLRPGAQVTKQDILDYCQGKVAYFKVPKYIKFVEAMPTNANGKVLKYKMLEIMKKEIESGTAN